MTATEKYSHIVLFNMQYKLVLYFMSVDTNYLTEWPFKSKLLSSSFKWYCLICCTWWYDEALVRDHSNESYYYEVQDGSTFHASVSQF